MSSTKPQDREGKSAASDRPVLVGIVCLLAIFALCGFRYPVVGRNTLLDLPRTLLWYGLGLSVFATTGLAVLTKVPGEGLGWFMLKWFFFYILGLLWSVAFLLAVNGIFDHGAHHLYPARVFSNHLESSVYKGNRMDQYYLVLADWQQPGGSVTIEVDKAIYDKIDDSIINDQVAQVETAPGCLGFERVIKVVSIAHAAEPNLLGPAATEDWSKLFSN